MAVRKPERPQGLDAYERIISEIRSGKLRPGDRLTETDLASQFKISRTPVREALRQLEADGLVAHTPRIGASIRILDHTEISELYDMRAVLEGTAARFAARAASDVELAELGAINGAMESTKDAQALHLLNEQFHGTLLNAARNRFLVKAVRAIHKTLFILGPSTMAEDARAVAAYKEHADILDALKRRDPEMAEAAMRAHIQAGHGARLRQLRKRIGPTS